MAFAVFKFGNYFFCNKRKLEFVNHNVDLLVSKHNHWFFSILSGLQLKEFSTERLQ